MIMTSLAEMEIEKDKRADDEYLSKEFKCNDVECGLYWDRHHHLHNIDPNFPMLPLKKESAARLIDGRTCCSVTCPHKESLHVHWPKNE
jgi:hypothetical protein